MKNLSDCRYSAALLALLVAVSPLAVRAQSVGIVVVDVVSVGKGYRVSQLIGWDVINEQNERNAAYPASIGKVVAFTERTPRVSMNGCKPDLPRNSWKIQHMTLNTRR